jgi:hypothetical protein
MASRSTETTAIDFSGQLRGALAASFRRECERRGCEPAALAADILETVIRDNLFSAVLDD